MKISESMDLFLKEVSGDISKKTAEKYRDVLKLFHDYLANYGDLSHEEHKDKGIILTAGTIELHDGQVSDFLEWFLIRKVLGPEWLKTTAPGIMKKYIKWLDTKGLLAEGAMDEIDETTKNAARNLPRVEKAAMLLYRFCEKNNDKLGDIEFEDKDYNDGYGDVVGLIEDKLFLNFDGEKTGPIQITKEIAKLLKKGDTVNLVVGRRGKLWYPLEVGNVYPG